MEIYETINELIKKCAEKKLYTRVRTNNAIYDGTIRVVNDDYIVFESDDIINEAHYCIIKTSEIVGLDIYKKDYLKITELW